MYLSVNSFNFSFSAKSKKEKNFMKTVCFLASEEVINTAYIYIEGVFSGKFYFSAYLFLIIS